MIRREVILGSPLLVVMALLSQELLDGAPKTNSEHLLFLDDRIELGRLTGRDHCELGKSNPTSAIVTDALDYMSILAFRFPRLLIPGASGRDIERMVLERPAVELLLGTALQQIGLLPL